MNFAEFKKYFLEFIENKENPYHPLVWINGNPTIGKNTYIGGFSEINAKNGKIIIGNNCDIASFVSINIADSHKRCIRLKNSIDYEDILIGNNVFIGSHCAILGGAKIGHNSVVGAGTVVRKAEIPPYSLVIGDSIKSGYYRNQERAIN